MALHDMMLNFANGLALPSAAGSVDSKIVDIRYNGGLEDHLFINATASAAPAATVTTKVMTSMDGKTWTEVGSSANDGNVLYAARLPANLKRFVKLTFTATGAETATVFAEITDAIGKELDRDMIQKDHEDISPLGDTVTKATT